MSTVAPLLAVPHHEPPARLPGTAAHAVPAVHLNAPPCRRGRRWVWPILFFVLLTSLSIVPTSTEAAVMAAARVVRCVGVAQDAMEPIGCERKLVVNLTVDRTQVTGTAADWRTTLSFAADTTLLADGSAAGATANVSFAPLTFTAALSNMQQRYTLSYTRNFSAALSLVEAWNGGMAQCQDAGNACGAYTRVDGTVVARSNGLCCACTYCLLSNCTGLQIEEICKGYTFGSLCLRSSEEKFAGYALGPLDLTYTLGVSVAGAGLRSQAGDDEVPFRLSANASSARVAVTINATSAAAASTAAMAVTTVAMESAGSSTADFSGYVLFIPAATATPPSSTWMLLAPALVTLDGSQCGRVGVAQEAWDAQAKDQCVAPKGTCYGGQLADLRAEDERRAAAGQNVRYMADGLGTFTRASVQTAQDAGPVDSLLGELSTLPTITLSFVLSADLLGMVLVPSPGTLESATAPDTAYGATTNTLTATTRNTGDTASVYYVSAGSCTPGVTLVRPLVVVLTLAAGQSTTTVFPVSQPATSTQRTLACTITLKDATNATTLVSRTVLWSTGTTAPPGEGGDGDNDTDGSGSTGRRQAAKCAVCRVTDFRCIWPNACIWQTAVWVAVAVAVAMAFVLVMRCAEMHRKRAQHRWALAEYERRRKMPS